MATNTRPLIIGYWQVNESQVNKSVFISQTYEGFYGANMADLSFAFALLLKDTEGIGPETEITPRF